ncbi:hypothetical protein BX666DRAFT_1974127 [Dichotomocladium elegans]|nr:hypothetical protein BX666DRAFT_1974127 [Dichotomocladium elegans]
MSQSLSPTSALASVANTPRAVSTTTSNDPQQESNVTPASAARKRTRATAEQLAVLEDTFAVNVSPNSKLRKQLSEKLQMSERSIQIWFQNRRAKVKHMQKRAQLQMQQASIRAQMYHQYHQYGSVPSPMHHHHQQQQQQQQSMPPPTHYYRPYPPLQHRVPLPPRAQSADPAWAHTTLVPVPDAGPTAILAAATTAAATNPAINATTIATPSSSSPCSLQELTTPSPITGDSSFWCTSEVAAANLGSIGMTRALSDPPMVTTIDPSSLMMTPQHNVFDVDDASMTTTTTKKSLLSATILTIGSWQRLKLRQDDLLCEYDADSKQFTWYIEDNDARFKIQVSLEAVSTIEYVVDPTDVLADVHFDISELPLFFMRNNKQNTATAKNEDIDNTSGDGEWVQCSDFTENKQASRFFRHTLRGVQHHLKQELVRLVDRYPAEVGRLVKFVTGPALPTPHDAFLVDPSFLIAAAAAAATAPSAESTSPLALSNTNALYWTPPTYEPVAFFG